LTLCRLGKIIVPPSILTIWLPVAEPERSVWFESSTDQREKLAMKVSTIILTTVLVLSSASAMAQTAIFLMKWPEVQR
jgi:hypothetical protein